MASTFPISRIPVYRAYQTTDVVEFPPHKQVAIKRRTYRQLLLQRIRLIHAGINESAWYERVNTIFTEIFLLALHHDIPTLQVRLGSLGVARRQDIPRLHVIYLEVYLL